MGEERQVDEYCFCSSFRGTVLVGFKVRSESVVGITGPENDSPRGYIFGQQLIL